jgi:protein-S-isoprenylcysteine O-methyltransferase Ste14
MRRCTGGVEHEHGRVRESVGDVQLLAQHLIDAGNHVARHVGRRLMPEARQLVTSGPYAFMRHPLYASEMFYLIGGMLQFTQPWAAVIVTIQSCFQWKRMINEERVLGAAFPAYGPYAARTPRLFPRMPRRN